MAHIAFPTLNHTNTLSTGRTYSYVHVPSAPSDPPNPYLLFLHGFPGSSFDWRHQIPYFQDRGYGLIVPDLLGYGNTDKPLEKEAYRMKRMCDDVVALLDLVKGGGGGEVVGIAHDWGCFLLSRLANYYPDHFVKFCWMDIGYSAPSDEAWDTDAIDKVAKQILGWPIFGYWHFFNDEDAGMLMERNKETLHSLLFPADPLDMKKNMVYPNACRDFFVQQKTNPVADWISPAELAIHDRIFRPEDGGTGYSGPLMWYKTQIANVNLEDERGVPEERKVVGKPVLMIAARDDPVGAPKMQVEGMRPWCKDLRVVEVETGHWCQQQAPREVNEALRAFVERKVGI